MAQRRMFSKTIIDSDLFLDMSLSTQALYFHLSMRADDDGFVNNPKKIQRMIGAGDDELKMLIAKQFIIPFESGICVIRHWLIHNYIRNDRYKETLYLKEKEQLEITNSKDYELKKNLGIPNDNQRETQVRLGKDSIGKDSIGYSSSSGEEVEEEESELKEVMNLCQSFNYKLRKIDAKGFIEVFGGQVVKKAIGIASNTEAFRNKTIKSYNSYLASILNDLTTEETKNININHEKKDLKFSNYTQRTYENDLYDDFIGWDE